MGFKPTKIKYKKPTNQELAKFLGLSSEGAIRAKKNKENQDEYQKILFDYKINQYPFINMGEYIEQYKVNKNILEKKILKKKITYLRDKNTKEPLIPFNLIESEELKDEYRELDTTSVISIINRSGGAGKSTNSINLATMYALIGYDVLVIDADTQSNTSQRLQVELGIEFSKTIIDVILEVGKGAKKETVECAILPFKDKINTSGRIDLLPNAGDYETQKKANSIEDELKLFSTSIKALDMTIELVKDSYDIVIIDTPPNDSNMLPLITMATDYFIFSYRPEDKAIVGVPMLFSTLKEELEAPYKMNKHKSIKIIGGIITDYDHNKTINQDIAEQIDEEFNKYNLKYNGSIYWKVFKQRIKSLTKFERIKSDGYGSLVSKASLSEEIDKNTASVIKSYMEITNEIIERILIDEQEKK